MPRRRLATIVLSLLALPFTVAAGQATSQGYFEPYLGSCGSPPPVVSSGSATSNAAIVSYSNNGCTMKVSAYAYLGVVGARTETGLVTGDWASGSIRAVASGQWSDQVAPTWNSRFTVLGVSSFRLFYNVSATGTVSATEQAGFGGGYAQISYDFAFASRRLSGLQSTQLTTPDGDWGTIAGYVDLAAIDLGNGTYNFYPFAVSLAGYAQSGVGKGYLQEANATATADFGSTLVWKGINSVQAYDAAGNELALPAGFRLQLPSQNAVGDYWDDAQTVTTVAPEPSTVFLLSAGLLALAVVARRRQRA